MKLSKVAIWAMRGSDRNLKQRIADALGVTENTIYRWINSNESNGDLTTAKALQLISEETGLSQEEILEEDSVPEIQK